MTATEAIADLLVPDLDEDKDVVLIDLGEQLQTIHFDGHSVRCSFRQDGPWIVARDLAAPLCIGRDAIRRATRDLEPEDVGVILNHTNKGSRKFTALSQSGVYQIIAQSRKPVGKRLRKWMADLTVAFERGKLIELNEANSRLAKVETNLELFISYSAHLGERVWDLERQIEAAATQDTQGILESNLVKQFLQQETVKGDFWVAAKTLFDAFCDWVRPYDSPWSHRKFLRHMSDLGHPRIPQTHFHLGLALKSAVSKTRKPR